MRCKKLGVLLAMVLVGVSAAPAWSVSAAETQDLPQQVLDISNGSDEIYGPGAPIEHVENPDERFSSGGVDHTHQYIVSNALKILNNDKGSSILNTKAAMICEYTDWPDVLGNETDYGTFAGHFYDPDTGKNWMGQKNPTARTRAETYYQSAVAAYKDGYTDKAMEYIGKGTHYVSDLNEPHHASNLTAVNSNHYAGRILPYEFPWLQMGVYVVVLVTVEFILSVWTIRRQKKQSLIEQMRAME